MGSLNKIMLIGNVGKDPEVRLSRAGESFATFSLATSYSYKTQAGDPTEQTEWFRIVMWRKLAEQAEKYIKKGRKLYIEGRVQTRSYDDQATGVKKYVTEVVADRMEFLDSRNDGTEGQSTGGSTGFSKSPSVGGMNKPAAPRGATAPDADLDDFLFDLDDLRKPF